MLPASGSVCLVLKAKKIQIRLAGGDESRGAVCAVAGAAAGGAGGAGPRVVVRRGWSPAPVALGGRSRSGANERMGRADGGAGGDDPWLMLEGREGREAGHQPKNSDEYLTFARGEDCLPTRDLSDRAHSMRGGDGKLLASTAGATIGRPRRYPACCMTTAGVSHDSMFDRTAELQRELVGIPGIGADSCPSMSKAVRAAMDQMRGRLGADGLRKATRWGATRVR